MSIASGIYLIRNIVNNKKYVGSTGSTWGFKKRWTMHKSQLRGGYHGNRHLQSAWNKYGENNFEFSILEECTDDMLIVREQSWMNYYNSLNNKYGYNLEAADRHLMPVEVIEKIRKTQMGNKYRLGTKHSQETKDKIGRLKLGTKQTKETIEKRRVSCLSYWDTLKRPILKLDLDGNLIKKYDSAPDAAKDMGDLSKRGGISNAVLGYRITAYGFKWRYA